MGSGCSPLDASEFERDLIRERVKSGMARAKAAIDREGHFVTKKGKVRKSIGRQSRRASQR